VVRKRRDPTWYPPASIRAEQPGLPAVVPPGPDNPLGRFALDLAWDGYLLHGTNKPNGVGRRVSHGCIRLYPQHIERLFESVPLATPVVVVEQEIKLGWSHGALYMEVHPNLAQAAEIEADGTFTPAPPPDIDSALEAAVGDTGVSLDWRAISRAVRDRSGLPVRVSNGR
ncbi:MAG TPA: L,D-transpeptidase family protein, partial [Kiloniellales bacterium]|nr:L,D-transpeptidase family protein [Kiloniellales bacterium]